MHDEETIVSVMVESDNFPGLCGLIAEKLAAGQFDLSYVIVQPTNDNFRAHYGFPNQEEAMRAIALFEDLQSMLTGRTTLRVVGGTGGGALETASAA